MDGWLSSLMKLPTNLKQSFEESNNDWIGTLVGESCFMQQS